MSCCCCCCCWKRKKKRKRKRRRTRRGRGGSQMYPSGQLYPHLHADAVDALMLDGVGAELCLLSKVDVLMERYDARGQVMLHGAFPLPQAVGRLP
eukprot:431131-Hanusia_phi.AAC.3